MFNPSKEYIAETREDRGHTGSWFEQGRRCWTSLAQTLRDRFELSGLKSIKEVLFGRLKLIHVQQKDVDLILNSHIFSNPISQECHEY